MWRLIPFPSVDDDLIFLIFTRAKRFPADKVTAYWCITLTDAHFGIQAPSTFSILSGTRCAVGILAAGSQWAVLFFGDPVGAIWDGVQSPASIVIKAPSAALGYTICTICLIAANVKRASILSHPRKVVNSFAGILSNVTWISNSSSWCTSIINLHGSWSSHFIVRVSSGVPGDQSACSTVLRSIRNDKGVCPSQRGFTSPGFRVPLLASRNARTTKIIDNRRAKVDPNINFVNWHVIADNIVRRVHQIG